MSTNFSIYNDIIGSLSPGTHEYLDTLVSNAPDTDNTNIVSSDAATIDYVNSLISNTASVDYVDSVTSNIASIDYVNSVTSNTASIDYVNSKTSNNATVEYVDSKVSEAASVEYVDSKTSNSATVEYVDSKVSEAASVEYVDSKTSNLATIEYVDSKPTIIEGGNDTLSHIVYNPITDKLEADRAIETTLNSLFLGEQHKMSSGAENIFFTNMNSKINFFPMWGGVKDQSKPENQIAGQGAIKPSGRCYGDFVEVEPNGPVDLTSNVFLPYNSPTFFANSVSGLGIQFYIGEPISSADTVFCYKLSINDIAVYEQILDIPNDLAIGDLVDWYFDHPVEIHAGTDIVAGVFKTSRETKIVGDAVVVFPSSDPAKRYFKLRSRSFEDVDLVLTNSGEFSGDVKVGSDIALNHSAGIITTNSTQSTDGSTTVVTKDYVDSNTNTLTSALKTYNIYVKSDYVESTSNSLSLNIYSNIETALENSNDGDSVYLDGVFNIISEITLPPNKSLHFYGNDSACIQYSVYSATNGSIFKYIGGDNSIEYKFKNIQFKNAGEFAVNVVSASKVDISDCVFENNGWSGSGIDLLNEELGSTLGFNSSAESLQTFYTTECSEGGAIYLGNIGKVEITDNTINNNNKGIEILDSGYIGTLEAFGFIARNQIYNNISIGINLESSTGDALAGCNNFTIYNNAVNQNGDTGVKIKGGTNNTLSLGVVKGNWNTGIKLSHVANTRVRDLDLDNNNRASTDAKGVASDGLASLQIEGNTIKDGSTFIIEVFNLQIHNTNLGSNTNKTGLLIKEEVGNVNGSAAIIKLDNIGFIEQDYAIDIAADLNNLRLIIGDCEYVNTRIKTVRLQSDNRGYFELPFSTFITDVPYADFTKDNITKTISILDGQGGKVINTYHKNQITASQKSTDFDIIITNTDKIQIRGLTEDRVFINGVAQTGTLSDVVNALNALFSETEGATPTTITTHSVNDEGTNVTTTTGDYTIDPLGDDEFAGNSTGYNHGYVFADQAIDQTGEYYTFNIRKEGIIGMGFHKAGSSGIYSLENLGTGTGNGHYGLHWSTWFYPTSDGPWTYYGEYSGQTSLGSGWYSFSSSSSGADWLADENVLMKAGIDNDGHLYLSYYDTTLEDYVVIAKNSNVSSEGDLFHLVIKFGDQNVRLYDTPKVHLRNENNLGSDLPDDQTIYLFGTATGTLGGGVSVPDATGSKSGLVTSASISELGQYFEFTRIGSLSSYAGLSNEEDFSATFIQSEMNASTSVTTNKFFYAGGFIYYNRDSWQPHGLVDPDGSSSGFSFNNGNGYMQRQNDSFRIGIDLDGKITYWQKLPGDNPYVVAAKSVNSVPTGSTFKFLWKAAQDNAELTSLTIGKLEAIPTLTYYAIESPDGQWHYPIFQTAEEANYFDSNIANPAGSGTSHTHVYVDDLSGTTWYMPDNGSVMNSTTHPSDSDLSGVTFNYVATGDDSEYTPTAFNQSINIGEGETLNLQIVPEGATFTTNVVGLPDWVTYSNGYLTGTAPYIPYNDINLIQVNRTNAFGTTNGTLTLTVTDDVVGSSIAGGTIISGSNTLAPNQILPHTNGALVEWDTVLGQGQEMVYSIPSSVNLAPTIGILSTLGQNSLSNYDVNISPLTTSGGTSLNPGNNFSWRSQWALRYVTFGGYLGGNGKEHYYLTGWSDNTTVSNAEGYMRDIELKLEYGTDGYIRFYRDGNLMKTSSSTYIGDQTIYFAGFNENNIMDIPSNLVIRDTVYTGAAITGWNHLTESNNLSSSNVLNDGSAVQLDLELRDGERIIFTKQWVEANILPFMDEDSESSDSVNGDTFTYLGVLSSTADISNGIDLVDFEIAFSWSSSDATRAANNHTLRTISGGSLVDSVGIGSKTVTVYDFAFDNRGGTVEALVTHSSSNNVGTEPSIANGGFWARYVSNSTFTVGETVSIVIGTKYCSASISNTGVSRIDSPLTNNQFNVTEDTLSLPLLSGPSVSGNVTPAAITMNAGQTYKFYLDDSSIESADILDFVLTSDSSDYTTGVTSFGTPGSPGAYVEFAVPQDVPPISLRWRSGGVDPGTNYSLNISGSTYVVEVTGITLEGPTSNQSGSNLFNDPNGSVVWGWLSIDEQLGADERLVLDNAFMVDLTDAMPNDSMVAIGLKDTTWSNNVRSNSNSNSFMGTARFEIYKYSSSDIRVLGYLDGSSTISKFVGTNGISNNNVELALEIANSGNNIRLMLASSDNSSDDVNSTTYTDWSSNQKLDTGDQSYGLTSIDVMILGDGQTVGNLDQADGPLDSADVDWTGLKEIPTPVAPTNSTSWNKSLDFSGNSERAEQVSGSVNDNPLMMGGIGATYVPLATGYTANNSYAWAVACVFQVKGNSSNQHIWNLGEGAGSTDDNIYLRVDAGQRLYFGWGRTGELNEVKIGTATGAPIWYGVYVGFSGARYSSSGATANNLANTFDIRLMSSYDNFNSVGNNLSTYTNWNDASASTGGRMDRQFSGKMTIGGRGSNRNFHGKVASFVSTTLMGGVVMPTDAEIKKMITDPMGWLNDYKVTKSYRYPWTTYNGTNFQVRNTANVYNEEKSTQVWIMGDGTNDSYSNMIRNQVNQGDQNSSKLNMVSMASNDIENVSIPGLS